MRYLLIINIILKYNLDVLLNLTMDKLTSIFVCKAFQIRGLILPKLLV